jgi:hypothetical protein
MWIEACRFTVYPPLDPEVSNPMERRGSIEPVPDHYPDTESIRLLSIASPGLGIYPPKG